MLYGGGEKESSSKTTGCRLVAQLQIPGTEVLFRENNFKKFIVENAYTLEKDRGKFRARVRIDSAVGGKKDGRRDVSTEKYQSIEILARIFAVDASPMAALFSIEDRRAMGMSSVVDGFSAIEEYSRSITTILKKIDNMNDASGGPGESDPPSDDPEQEPLGGLRSLVATGMSRGAMGSEGELDIVTASHTLRRLVDNGNVAEAEKLDNHMLLFVILFRTFSQGALLKSDPNRLRAAVAFTNAMRPDFMAGDARIFDYEVNTALPAFMFPEGVINDAVQFNYACLNKDIALYMELGLKLHGKLKSIKANAEHANLITSASCSPLPELYRSTAKWMLQRFVYYNKSDVLGGDLIGTDRQDSMHFKFELMTKGLLVAGQHTNSVLAIQDFVIAAKPLFAKFAAPEQAFMEALGSLVGEVTKELAGWDANTVLASIRSYFSPNPPLAMHASAIGDSVKTLSYFLRRLLAVIDKADSTQLEEIYEKLIKLGQ